MNDIIKNIDKIRENIYLMLKEGYIDSNDINKLVNYKFTDINDLNYNSYKDRTLLCIYINPYLLCTNDLIELSNIDIDLYTKLLIKRYNEEIYEYNSRLEEGVISYDEYNNSLLILNRLYFKDSTIGIKLETINNNKILKKRK